MSAPRKASLALRAHPALAAALRSLYGDLEQPEQGEALWAVKIAKAKAQLEGDASGGAS